MGEPLALAEAERDYHGREGTAKWRPPTQPELDSWETSLANGTEIYVYGWGEGKVVGFVKSWGWGWHSQHQIELRREDRVARGVDGDGVITVRLERKHNGETKWLKKVPGAGYRLTPGPRTTPEPPNPLPRPPEPDSWEEGVPPEPVSAEPRKALTQAELGPQPEPQLEPEPQPEPEPEPTKEQTEPSAPPGYQPPDPTQHAILPPQPPVPRPLRAQASWDFTPTGKGQVALSAGESVVVTDRTNEKRGWVVVRKASGETGNTPFGYLKMLAPEPPAALPPPPAPPQDTPAEKPATVPNRRRGGDQPPAGPNALKSYHSFDSGSGGSARSMSDETAALSLQRRFRGNAVRDKLSAAAKYPAEWSMQPITNTGGQPVCAAVDGLVDVPPTEKEYWDVLEALRAPSGNGRYDAPMTDAFLVSLQRVQNPTLYTYFNFQKTRLEMGTANLYPVQSSG